MEGSDSRWRGAIAGGGERSQVPGGGERSQVEGSEHRLYSAALAPEQSVGFTSESWHAGRSWTLGTVTTRP